MVTTTHQIISGIYIFCYYSYRYSLDIDYHFLLTQVRSNFGTMTRIPPNVRRNQMGEAARRLETQGGYARSLNEICAQLRLRRA